MKSMVEKVTWKSNDVLEQKLKNGQATILQRNTAIHNKSLKLRSRAIN